MNDNIKQFRGSGNHYFEIGTRVAESLGLGVRYAQHPNGIGYFIVRFVAHSGGKSVFTHFHARESAQFADLPGGQSAEHSTLLVGKRLNKIAIPVFKPAVYPYEVLSFGDSLTIWPVIGQWIHTQAELEGFTVNTDIPALVRSLFITPFTDAATVAPVVEFPDLADYKAKAKSYKPPVLVPDDEDEDNEDGDEDDEEDDSDTIN